jgi:hypothetical protein
MPINTACINRLLFRYIKLNASLFIFFYDYYYNATPIDLACIAADAYRDEAGLRDGAFGFVAVPAFRDGEALRTIREPIRKRPCKYRIHWFISPDRGFVFVRRNAAALLCSKTPRRRRIATRYLL